MTTITSTNRGHLNPIQKVLFSIENYFATRSAYVTTFNELNRLSEHELNDLGLCRADIQGIAKKAAGLQ